MRKLLDTSVNMLKTEIRHRAQLVKEYEAVPPVAANESRLGQVFMNLLHNAAQAIPEGKVRDNKIRIVTGTDADGSAIIEFHDTGCGIASEDLTRIFDVFYTTKPIGVGTEITPYIEGPFARGRAPGQSSFAVTLLGDFYINFGWMGIVGGGMFLGVLCRVVAVYATTGMRGGIQTRAARVLIPAVFIMGLGEVRADVATSLTTYGLSLVPLLVALTFFNLEPVSTSARVVGQLAAEEA